MHGVKLRRRAEYTLAHTSLYEPIDPDHVFSALAYVVTRDAAQSLGRVDDPFCEPDRWGSYLQAGLLDQVVVSYPFVAGNGLYSSTIGYDTGGLPRPLRLAVDAAPLAGHWLRRRREAYVTRITTPKFVD